MSEAIATVTFSEQDNANIKKKYINIKAKLKTFV
jgi:hypothetical protein